MRTRSTVLKPGHSATLAGVLLLSACAGAVTLQSALSTCALHSSGHSEVYIPRATVVRVLGLRSGPSGVHEGFIVAVNARTYRIEDNTGITGPIPLQRGDVLSVLGQFECDDDVIHWTHRELRGHHPSGYIKVNGKLYD